MRHRKVEVVRPVRKRILILCEGAKTEPNYFNALKKSRSSPNPLSALIIVHDSKKHTGKELVAEAIELQKEAIKERNPYNSVWIVIDRDGYKKHPETFDRAKSTNIKIAFSSACFEYWILLHFEYTSAAFSDCDAVIHKLKTYLPDYEKKQTHFDSLKSKIPTAIERSKRIIQHWKDLGHGTMSTYSPYTDVGLLVEYLLSL